MPTRLGLCLLASLALLASCSPQSGTAPPTQLSDARSAFALDLPHGFAIVKRPTAVEDFEIFQVRRGEVPYVSIYAGNAPNTAIETAGAQRLLETEYCWPRYLHVWVHDLPPDQKREADAIAASVRTD